jgi:hypothetical protein
MQLPLYPAQDPSVNLLQTRWKSVLDPVLANPATSQVILTNIALVVGNNQINHKLGQLQQGWFITDINAAAKIYRSAPFNTVTLTLNSDTACTISLGVF